MADLIANILSWAESHPTFDTAFTLNVQQQLHKKGKLSAAQLAALERICTAYKVPRWASVPPPQYQAPKPRAVVPPPSAPRPRFLPTAEHLKGAKVVGHLNLSGDDRSCTTTNVDLVDNDWARLTVDTPKGTAEIYCLYHSCECDDETGAVLSIELDGGVVGCDVPITVGATGGGGLEWIYVDMALLDSGRPVLIMTGCMYYCS